MAVGARVKKKDEVQPTRYYSKKQEDAVAKNLNGKRTPNSGATPFVKGDVLLDDWLLECKTCTKKQNSFSIKKDWILKNREEQMFMNKDNSAVVFNFGPDEENFYIIDERTFKMLIQSCITED
jgi:hypothetical protein